ncbi:phospholipase A1 [Bactrocera dorsalis]|uniref:Phospholipase A1 n=1 Tax=Bactrocera dorsalis TaxID=27457 RepID=A0A6I9UQY3_BACDO|nr:phospholipase A1 [Bactrocera dorsalis]
MKFLYFITLFAILHNQARLVSPAASAINSILAKSKSLLDNIYKTFTHVVPALPLKMGTSTINLVCTTFHNYIQKHIPAKFTPKLKNIKLQLRTACAKREYPLSDLSGLAADKDFDRKKKTVIMSTGWTTQVDNGQHDILAKAYNCRGDTNYLALDVSDYIQTLYTWSSENTNTIGKYVAKGLQKLLTFIDVADLHLIGHSLGAQIMGSAARHYRMLTGKSLPYVTGLDPALPCFSIRKGLSTLSSQDADFVDIIHTDPGVLGQYETYGHVGFYVGGKYPIKNGCTTPSCSHGIVIPFYAESVYPNNNRDFIAKQCTSSKRLNCNGAETVMGFAVSHNARGTYMLETNAKAPYGKNAGSGYTDPKSSKCGTCQG